MPPPHTLTPAILHLVAEISEWIGLHGAATARALTPRLRRINQLRSIQASLAIENNTLTLAQVSAVVAGKRVLGPPREILEVRNALKAYEAMGQWHPDSRVDLLAAHKLLMAGLVDKPGAWRGKGIGVFRGEALVHKAPPADRVDGLMRDLLDWVRTTDAHPLVASCVFHYEFEFIHPFEDGNGRMGRLWQTLILRQWKPVLGFIPVETLIHERQQAYYDALAAATQAGESSPFIVFMLEALRDAVREGATAEKHVEKHAGKHVEKHVEKTGQPPVKTSAKILAALQADSTLSALQLAEKLGLKRRTIEDQLAKLKKAGKLRRVGPDKGGHWEIL